MPGKLFFCTKMLLFWQASKLDGVAVRTSSCQRATTSSQGAMPPS